MFLNSDPSQAYFTPNVSEAHELLSKKLPVRKFMGNHRSQWINCCSDILESQSEQFAKNQTFGWFHFHHNVEKAKMIDQVIVTADVACFEVSQYDPTGENPGSPVKEFTQDVIEKLEWTKEKAKQDAQALRKAFPAQTSSGTSSPAKKNDGSKLGTQKTKQVTPNSGNKNSTEDAKPEKAPSQMTSNKGDNAQEPVN